jgi:hypothetical protein
MREGLDHLVIGLALERHDQARKVVHGFPFPGIEFGLVAVLVAG